MPESSFRWQKSFSVFSRTPFLVLHRPSQDNRLRQYRNVVFILLACLEIFTAYKVGLLYRSYRFLFVIFRCYLGGSRHRSLTLFYLERLSLLYIYYISRTKLFNQKLPNAKLLWLKETQHTIPGAAYYCRKGIGNREPIGSRKLVTSKCVGKPGTII